MPVGTKEKIEFGDFQTPDALARRTCEVLQELGVNPRSIIEPTCGKGAFLRAITKYFPYCKQVMGFEINRDYVHEANAIPGVDVYCQDFFKKNWAGTLNILPEPILVIGNPPWVTNAAVGILGGSNLPTKSNFHQLNGFDAITGKGNFDISEWMLLHLLEWLSGREAVLAMLCKTAVARKVLSYAWRRNLQISGTTMFLIDAAKHFNASVDACLLVSLLKAGGKSKECEVHPSIDQTERVQSTFAFQQGRLVSDLNAFKAYGRFAGDSPIRWRSGVKHDCSPIIELRRTGFDEFQNGLDEVVSLESTNLYPMVKSSDLMKGNLIPSRYMLVTQQSIGEDTARIAKEAPLTWQYLNSHAEQLDRRRSSIYRNKPRFSVFGVGPYTFAPWKVATSGFSKRLEFHTVGPFEEKPVVLDDTCYFLPCSTQEDAESLVALLNSKEAKGFFQSFVFWDSKRPITAQLLATLDLTKLAGEFGVRLPTSSGVPTQGVRPYLPGLEPSSTLTD